MGRAVNGAYQQALEEVLLVGLRENLLKDLYVYNKLDDPVKSLELYNLYQQLSDPERTGIDALIDYYVESLQAEGEGDVATLERFRQLVRDLLKPGVVPPPSDDPLIELVKTSLASEDLGDLLYQHILQQPGFSRRVDLRDNLGPNHGQVLAFEPGYGGYLMPYIFTREGFQELMSGTRFQLAAEALKDYEELVGRISGETELGRINRKLRRRYIEDYVSHWQRFADSIRWVPAEGWGDTRQQLATAAEPLFSPLRRYYGLISRHTDLAALLAEPGAEADAARTPKLKGKTGSVAKKVQGPLDAQREAERSRQLEEQRQSALKMADAIAQPFVHYHRLIAPDDAGQSHLDLALRQVNQALEWVREATQGPNRGRFFLDQLAAPESLSPLAQMQSLGDAYSDPLLRDLLQGGAARLNELAMADVRALLNERWRSDVMAFYDNRIGPFYPFARQASQDVGLPAFREFFGPAGLAAVFGDSFLSYFSVRDSGDPVLDSFLPGRFLALDGRFWRAMTELERIRGAFFTADTPGLRFAIRADAMSPDLTEFSLRDEGPLYRYRNGPSLWAEMSWPVPESRSRDLEVKLSGNDHVVLNRRYPGLWNWFRLTESMQVSATADAATSQLVAAEGDSLVRLQLRVEGETNPFVEGFFTALDLPENL
ncbi:ImcF-related family protein [Marinobacterium aestuariivivens]|uniref:ImcF-related family protein n=1 Tax=Marinobacterium aestuariivivens TaxID=1698799 RepID=A0ABW1ZZK7_9GAMM